MKDFNTGKEIDMQGMLDMLKYAEEAKDVRMRNWITQRTCGTAGCLVGTYILRTSKGLKKYSEMVDAAYDFYLHICFGLSPHEKRFLFTQSDFGTSIEAIRLEKDEAIARLRKFIYYKLRKAELLEDYQASRRIEGDKFFALAYKESASKELASVE